MSLFLSDLPEVFLVPYSTLLPLIMWCTCCLPFQIPYFMYIFLLLSTHSGFTFGERHRRASHGP